VDRAGRKSRVLLTADDWGLQESRIISKVGFFLNHKKKTEEIKQIDMIKSMGYFRET